jgi:hypothetical protein
MDKQIKKITLDLDGDQDVKELSGILTVVVKATGLQFVRIAAKIQQQIIDQVKKDLEKKADDQGPVHQAEQLGSNK